MGVGLSDEENRKQFAGIVVPHLSEAFAVASWLTGNRTDAEDVVQEACLRAFRAIGSFAGVNARAWVLTIVRHTAYSWLAKNRPSEIVAVEDFLGEERLTEHVSEDGPPRSHPLRRRRCWRSWMCVVWRLQSQHCRSRFAKC